MNNKLFWYLYPFTKTGLKKHVSRQSYREISTVALNDALRIQTTLRDDNRTCITIEDDKLNVLLCLSAKLEENGSFHYELKVPGKE